MVQPSADFFSMEHHLEYISVGTAGFHELNTVFVTNSDHMLVDLLLNTDLCSLGVSFMDSRYEQYDIHPVELKNCDKCLLYGYVKRRQTKLSAEADDFLGLLQKSLKGKSDSCYNKME